jgi:hypothetical protein
MTILSGNTLGARVWTDAKQMAPMNPETPPFIWCRHCQQGYWLADAKRVRNVGRTSGLDNQRLEAEDQIHEPTAEQYYEVLETHNFAGRRRTPGRSSLGWFLRLLFENTSVQREREKTLRVLAWWRHNDAYRNRFSTDNPPPVLTDACKRNLHALIAMLDATDNDRIMRAELLRELGNFAASKAELDRITSSECSGVVSRLRSLCDAGDPYVHPL